MKKFLFLVTLAYAEITQSEKNLLINSEENFSLLANKAHQSFSKAIDESELPPNCIDCIEEL